MTVQIVKNIFELKRSIALRRAEPANSAATVGIVPTMGSIHEAHKQLVKCAKKHSDIIVSTIFVNPKQFGENEDFKSYPRSEKKDIVELELAGSDIIYIPSVEDMYPKSFDLNISVPNLSSVLCGKYRKNHFDGVATVVSKLLIQSNADYGFFGEKDFQQLLIIKRLVTNLDLNCKIVSIPTVRDKEGLAISSRNKYLDKEKKIIANNLYKIIKEAGKNISDGKNIRDIIKNSKNNILKCGFTKIDYFELRSEKDLKEIDSYDNNIRTRLFLAAHIENIRLIDNIII